MISHVVVHELQLCKISNRKQKCFKSHTHNEWILRASGNPKKRIFKAKRIIILKSNTFEICCCYGKSQSLSIIAIILYFSFPCFGIIYAIYTSSYIIVFFLTFFYFSVHSLRYYNIELRFSGSSKLHFTFYDVIYEIAHSL